MTTTLIAAVARNGVIGHQNAIPWYLPEDFAHFKATTKGQTVIMGSRTWASLPKRPLPGRLNMVVTRQVGSVTALQGHADTFLIDSIEDAIYYSTIFQPEREIYIIGGETIYRQSIDGADRLLISEVDMEPDGDTFFPDISPEMWYEASRDERVGFSVVEYLRKRA